MSPTVFRYKGYRFFFFSREETRMHIHVTSSEGEAKFWLEPTVALCENHGLSSRALKMRSSAPGKSTSLAEVQDITRHGIWLFVKGREFMLSFEDYPWFMDAAISAVHKVQLLHGSHLYWPELDVDLDLASLENPERYPLVAKKNA